MLKSLILKPTDDILSYRDHVEFPFNVFPRIILIYGEKNQVELDEKELVILYKNDNNNLDYKNNMIEIKLNSIKTPRHYLIKKNKNCLKLKENKFKKIRKILPFCNDVKNIIINFIIKEKLKWKIKTKKMFSLNPSIINKYNITDETKISIKKLKNISEKSKIFSVINSLENPPSYKRRDLKLHKIIYGVFQDDSYIPSKINTISLNNYMEKNITIHEHETIKILLYMKRKERHRTVYENDGLTESSDYESNFITEDILYRNIYM